MPKADESRIYLELTQYSLHALRAVGGVVEAGGECVLENKASLDALLDAVAPDRKTAGLRAVASVWPSSTQWYVSTDTEAMLDRTEEALKAIASGKLKDPTSAFAYAVCGAADGAKVTPDGMDKWVMAFSPLESLENVSKGLMDLNVDPDDVKPAGLPGIGAIAAALKFEGSDNTVALWDIGSDASNLVLVTARGAEGSAPCSSGMEGVFQAIQTVLKLKFRGAGARLFFNEGYDFTDPGPKVGAIIGASVKEALASLPPQASPPRLACLGLTGKQAWFLREVAAAAGTTAWEPDIPKLAAELGLTFAEGAPVSSFSVTSAGLLGLAAMKVASRDEWGADWAEAEGQVEEEPPPPPIEEEPEPAPPPPREPEPVRPAAPPARAKPSLTVESQTVPMSTKPRPSVGPKSVTAPPFPGGGALKPPSQRPPSAPPAMAPPAVRAPVSAPPPAFPASGSPPPPSFPSAAPAAPSFPAPGGGPARPPSFSNPGFPTPTMPPMPMPARSAMPPPPSFPSAAPAPPSFSNPGFPAPTMPPMPMPGGSAPPMPPAPGAEPPASRPVTALPFDAVKLKPVLPGSTTAPFKGGSTSAPFKSGATNVPFEEEAPPKSRMGLYIGIGVAAAVVFAGIAVVVESRLEAIKARDQQAALELQAKIDHDHLEKEAQLAAVQAEETKKENAAILAEATKQAAEDEKKSLLAQQEEDRKASLPGTILLATVPAGASVSIDGGPSLISPVKATGIKPGPHSVAIVLSGYDPVQTTATFKGGGTADLGTIPLVSALGELDLTSNPDGLEFAVHPAADPTGTPVKTGHTPASFNDLMHGDYSVVFMRPGCRDHTETASVSKGGKTPVTTTYVDGSLDLTSDPSGASVSKDGEFLGTTPLSLHDLTPKTAAFVLTLPGYDSTPVSCEIPEGQTLKYAAQLLRKDRVFTADEVKTPPVKVDAPAPVLSASQRKLGANILLSFEVTQDGTVTDVRTVHATDDDIARRCKSAVEKWRYRPATAPDDRIVDSRIEVPFKYPAGGP
jgi:TonB family protein